MVGSSWTATNLWPSQCKILALQLSACWYISSFSPQATGSKEKKRRWRNETPCLRSTTAALPARKDTFSFLLKHEPFLHILSSLQHRPRCLLRPQQQPTQSSSHHRKLPKVLPTRFTFQRFVKNKRRKQATGSTRLTQVERPGPITALWRYVRKVELNRKRDFTEGCTRALAAGLRERMKKDSCRTADPEDSAPPLSHPPSNPRSQPPQNTPSHKDLHQQPHTQPSHLLPDHKNQ